MNSRTSATISSALVPLPATPGHPPPPRVGLRIPYRQSLGSGTPRAPPGNRPFLAADRDHRGSPHIVAGRGPGGALVAGLGDLAAGSIASSFVDTAPSWASPRS